MDESTYFRPFQIYVRHINSWPIQQVWTQIYCVRDDNGTCVKCRISVITVRESFLRLRFDVVKNRLVGHDTLAAFQGGGTAGKHRAKKTAGGGRFFPFLSGLPTTKNLILSDKLKTRGCKVVKMAIRLLIIGLCHAWTAHAVCVCHERLMMFMLPHEPKWVYRGPR